MMKKTMKSVIGLVALGLMNQNAFADLRHEVSGSVAAQTQYDGLDSRVKKPAKKASPLAVERPVSIRSRILDELKMHIVMTMPPPVLVKKLVEPEVGLVVAQKLVRREVRREMRREMRGVNRRLAEILNELRESRTVCPKTAGASSTEQDTPGNIVDRRSDQ